MRTVKHVLAVALALTIGLCLGQIKDPLKGSPNSIQESFLYFDRMFDDTAKYTFLTFPEDIATARLHHRFGMWIRNNWGLWGSGPLKRELIDSGFVHPDDMSSVLLKAYHRKLHNEPLKLMEEAKAYQAYWSEKDGSGFSAADLGTDHDNHTTIEELLALFPVGDTIIVNLYASYKRFFRSYASGVRGIAIVRSHSTQKLGVELLALQHKKKHEPEHRVGDVFDISQANCDLIPPKNWSIPSR